MNYENNATFEQECRKKILSWSFTVLIFLYYNVKGSGTVCKGNV